MVGSVLLLYIGAELIEITQDNNKYNGLSLDEVKWIRMRCSIRVVH